MSMIVFTNSPEDAQAEGYDLADIRKFTAGFVEVFVVAAQVSNVATAMSAMVSAFTHVGARSLDEEGFTTLLNDMVATLSVAYVELEAEDRARLNKLN